MGVESDLLPANGPEVDSSITNLPDDHNIYLATRRISQFESPTRHSRRSFLRMLGLGAVGVATGGAAYALLPRNDASAAATPPTIESKTEPLNLTAAEVFGGNVTTEAELRKNPDDIRDFKLVTDTQGNVSEIVLLARDDKSVGKSLDDKSVAVFVNRMILNQQTKRFDPAFQTHRTPLSILAESVVKVGKRMIVGGQTTWSSYIPTLFESVDSVRPFEPIPISSADLASVTEINHIPNTPKIILNLGTSFAVLDLETKKIVEILSGNRNGVVIATTSADNQTTSVYSKRNLSGLSRELINLSTGQVLDSQLFFRGVDIDGYDFKKDASGKPTHVLVTDEANQRDLVLELATNIITPTSYQALLDKIPVTKKEMLLFRSVSIVNDWIWEAGQFTDGDGSGGVVVFARPFYTDPNVNSKDVAVYVIIKDLSGMPGGGISQQGFKRGIFGGLPGHLLNIIGSELVFIPSNQDGSPIAGATPTHLGIKDNPPPTVNIPVVLDVLR